MNDPVLREAASCRCGEVDCLHYECDYPFCRPCGEHHRAPECAVDTEGRALAPCGHPWPTTGADMTCSCFD